MSKAKEINDFYKIQNKMKKQNIQQNNKKQSPKNSKKSKTNKKVNVKKIVLLATFLIVVIVLILRSNLFDIINISVTNNSKISSEEIIVLSGLKIGQNMFSFSKRKVEQVIKQNSYIENVQIHRSFNKTLEIKVEERHATFQVEMNGQYGYINNQGYLLEISTEAIVVPTIVGLSNFNIDTGNRLDVLDLNKLNDIIQIMNVITAKGLQEGINKIDISDDENYIIYMLAESKTVYFGSTKNINDKIDWIEYMLQQEAGKAGEFFVDNVEKPYFREKV